MDELKRKRRIEHFEKLGEETVRADMATGGYRHIGGSPEVRKLAREWLAGKERQRQKAAHPSTSDNVTGPLILQPNFFGLGIDLKKVWRKVTQWVNRD